MKMQLLFKVLLVLVSGKLEATELTAADWLDKIDPWVQKTASAGSTEFLVLLTAQGDMSSAAAMQTKIAKQRHVYQQLTETAARTQAPVIAVLDDLGVEYRSYWVINGFWVRGDLAAIRTLAQRGDVAHIYANPRVRLELPVGRTSSPNRPAGIEWNIAKINADDLWALGYSGQGVVIGGADTGYDWDHPALLNHYRGWNGSASDHNYNWHDATKGSPTSPIDPQGHGTHTMGTMVGDDGGGNQIGVAPGAKWIGCRNMDAGGYGTPATYIDCFQWFIAPTDLNGTNPRPDLAPDVINNSWSCTPSEGCTNPGLLLTAVQAVRAAGILTVQSAGNSGSACSTVDEPAAIYAESFSVGATDSTDTIAGFSSRGPVTIDGSNRSKPNISAPGVSVRSCVPGTGYANMSGTSMAGPHVAGLVALLLSAKTALGGQVESLETLIEYSAVTLTTQQNCGGVPGDQRPNNTYGWGRIDAWSAFQGLHLPVTVHKVGQGIVTSQPTGIACGETCTATFTEGTTLMLNASPADAHLFGGWGDDCAVQVGKTCTLTNITAAKTATATFLDSKLVLPNRGGWRAGLGQ